MRTVATAAKNSVSPELQTVLTARASSEQFGELWTRMQSEDVLASPGPTRFAEVELSSGQEASIIFHERPHLLEILAPVERGIEIGLADLLVGLNVEPEAITWTHDRVDRAAIVALQSPPPRIRVVRNDATERVSVELNDVEHPDTSPVTRVQRASAVLAPAAREAELQAAFEKHYPRLVRFVRAYRLSEHDSEDLAQEAFIRFFQSMNAYQREADWSLLESVARSVVFNRIRAQKTVKRSTINVDEVDLAGESPDYAEREQKVLRRKLLHDAIAALPDTQRQCVQLWLDGFRYAEVAGALEISVDAVKSRLRDGKKRLRETLEDEEAFREALDLEQS